MSWHRTMTQPVTPETVTASFDGQEMEHYGWKFRPQTRDGKYWIDIEGTQSQRQFHHELVLATGSHHMQKFWYPTGNGRELGLVPLVYVREAERWMPEHPAFLRPTEPGLAVREGDWNEGCNQCHGAWVMKKFEGSDGANIGHHYRPGDNLDDTRHNIHGAADEHLRAHLKAEDSFWSDGQIRVTGREYNGLLGLPCFDHDGTSGEQMSCLPCHDMHASTTDVDKTLRWTARNLHDF